MLRSLYAAVSGVKAHQTYLDVTGNNIANVNTVGFKRDTVQFRDMIYQTMKNPSAPDNGVPIGGVNPGQVGLGVSVGAIETIYTEGSMQSTGVNTDMMITGGAGFFVVDSGNGILYTRAGNFELDADGNLTMAGLGYKVQGYAYKNQIDPVSGELTRVRDSTMGDIVIKAKEKIPAKATTLVAFRSNLCSTAEKEIADLSGIPGGPNAVCRPQEYTSYEVKAATYVGTNVPPSGAAGQTWFNGEYVYKYDAGAWVWDSDTLMYSSDIYWGQNTDTDPPFETISRGVNEDNGTPTNIGALAENGVDKIDIRGLFVPTNDTTAPPPPWPYIPTDGPSYEPDPAKAVPPISKAGQTYINETTGLIYTTNSAGTMWDLDSPTPYDTKKAYYVGSSYTTGFTPDEKTYIQETGTSGWNNMVQVDNVLTVSSDGKARVIAWNKSCGAFTDINLANGLCPSDGAIATQESITAFGQSMINSPGDWETKFNIYDSLGSEYTMIVKYRKVLDKPAYPNAAPPTGAEAEWDWYAYYVDSDGNAQPQYGQGAGTLVFGDDGVLKRTYYYEPTPALPNTAATATTAPVYNWSVVEKIVGDPAYDNVMTGKVVADFNVSGGQGSVGGTDTLTYSSNMITLDFLGQEYARRNGNTSEPIGGVTQFGSSGSMAMYSQDGYEMGILNDWNVSQTGVVTGSYSNGKNLPVAQLVLATFINQQGLVQSGNSCFAESVNSGLPSYSTPGSGGTGNIVGGALEMSNVDLSEEFVNLIRAQRGFQANTRVVTTSDQVLEELINLKR